ncbi:MAG: AtpZ/AtpI family protein [Parvularculaceae bacterium]
MAEDAGQQQPPSLDEFSKRLDAARGDPATAETSRAGLGRSTGRALRVASELLAALFVGSLAGWGLDVLLGTTPWLLLLGIGLGFAAGVFNVGRALKYLNKNSSENG